MPSSTALVAPNQYEQMLMQREDRLTQLLSGSDIDPQRFIGMTVQALARHPELRAPNIDKESVLLAVLTTAEMGLTPTGAGGTHLVVYGNKVSPITDWRGLIKMALRSGQLLAAWAHPVYEGDEFSYRLGQRPRLEHVPTTGRGEDPPRGNLTHAYAVLHLANGERVFEVMTVDEIEAIRKRSRAGEKGPWVTDYIEMVRKTPLRRIFKYTPQVITPQLEAALRAEDEMEDAVNVTPVPTSDRRTRLLAHMAGAEIPAGADDVDGEDQPSAPTTEGDSADAGTAEAEDAS